MCGAFAACDLKGITIINEKLLGSFYRSLFLAMSPFLLCSRPPFPPSGAGSDYLPPHVGGSKFLLPPPPLTADPASFTDAKAKYFAQPDIVQASPQIE